MDILKCFKHLMFATPYIVRLGKPTNASQKDFDIAMAALLALAED